MAASGQLPTEQQLEGIWSQVTQQQQVRQIENLQVDRLATIVDVFTRAYRTSTLPSGDFEQKVPEDLLSLLRHFLSSRLSQTPTPPPWKMDIQMGNQHVKKNVQLFFNIQVGSQQVQFDIEQFAKLRQGLAKTILDLEKYD